MSKDYRRLYKKYYGINIGPNMTIHHIDGNHDNNDISNLLMLPRELHAAYHYYLDKAWLIGKGSFSIDPKLSGSIALSYNNQILRGLVETMEKCEEWVRFKEQLDAKKRENQ